MNEKQNQELKNLLTIHQRRLQILEIQAANFGLSTPAHILLEIEDIQNKIKEIESNLAGFQGNTDKNQTEMTKVKTVLFMSADPSNATRLRLGEELREIQERLHLAKMRDLFRLEQRMSVRPKDIIQALLDEQPCIVHFSGHGTKDGDLCFENESGNVHTIKPEALAALFEQFEKQVECVLLNACFSEKQANAIATHINYVIGMKKEIGDAAAISFAAGFYSALGAERTIESAFKLGLVELRLLNIPEYLTPVLIKKKGI